MNSYQENCGKTKLNSCDEYSKHLSLQAEWLQQRSNRSLLKKQRTQFLSNARITPSDVESSSSRHSDMDFRFRTNWMCNLIFTSLHPLIVSWTNEYRPSWAAPRLENRIQVTGRVRPKKNQTRSQPY
jgi:hypothetical protein